MTNGRPKRRTVAALFLLLWVLLGSWALATPLFGGPDEPTHVIRAASVARGQILGPSLPGPGYTAVHVPGIYDEMDAKIPCWVRDSRVTPSCAGTFEGSSREVETKTYVGRYNPAYYAVVGLPSLAFPDGTGIYLMRLVSAAICAGLFTFATLAALRAKRPPLALVGLAFCLTPMVCFLAGVVNPSGLEIAAAACLWMGGLLFFDPRTRSPAVMAWTVVGASALVVSRGLSPVWLVVIVALQALAALPDRGRSLRDRRLWLPTAVVLVVGAAAGAWIVWARALTVFPVGPPIHGSTPAIALSILGQTDSLLRQMVGGLQWVETDVPSLTYAIWLVGVGTISLLALAAGRRRARIALVACAAATLLTPLLQIPSIRTMGWLWQGRYSLPLALGIPVLAMYVLSDAGPEVYALLKRLAAGLGIALGIAAVAAFFWAGRRNAVGTDGPFWFIGREDWRPPVPFVFLLALNAASVSVLILLFLKVVRVQDAGDGRAGAPPAAPAWRATDHLWPTPVGAPRRPSLGEPVGHTSRRDDALYDETVRHAEAEPGAIQRETS